MPLFRSAVFSGCLLLCVVLRIGLFVHAMHEPAQPCALGLQQLEVAVNQARQRRGAPTVLDVRVRQQQALPDGCRSLVGERLRLSWYRPGSNAVRKGQVLTIMVKLKALSGTINPGGFDYARWLRGQGYAATGYVRRIDPAVADPLLADPLIAEPGRSRHGAPDSIFHGLVYGGLLAALTLGEQSDVTDAQWRLLRATGTIHLVVVSGLHIGILGGLAVVILHGLLRLLPRRVFYAPGFPPRVVAGLSSVGVIICYTALIGAAAPVVRASLMAGLAILAFTCMRPLSWWRIYLLGLALSILLNPAAVLQQGFYLSFIAVFILLWTFGPRMRSTSWVRSALTCQFVLSVGLAPWVGLLVGEVPLVSALANIIVVPPMTLVIIPLALVGALVALAGLESLGVWLLLVPDFGLAIILTVLEQLRELAPALGPVRWPLALLVFGGALMLSLPRRRLVFGLGVLAWQSIFHPVRMFVPIGEVRVQVLDVGQGSAALIDTAQHRLIVDAGPRYRSGFDVGAAVVVPALRYSGPDQLDMVLLSHWDNDHAGGLEGIRMRYPDVEVIAPGEGCRSGRSWRWDGVTFTLLTHAGGASANDRSCTLVVTSRNHRAFFAGDIGRGAESHLLPQLPRNVDLLVAPHHGSETSSQPAFVARTRPRLVLYSVGRDNRYDHPRATVVTRYRKIGAAQFSTADGGALIWRSSTGHCLFQLRLGAFCLE